MTRRQDTDRVEVGHPGQITTVLEGLFDGLPHVMFCIKDTTGRYVMVNQAFAERAQKASPNEIVGTTARDLFPADLATSYEAQDRQVMRTGRNIRNRLEVVLRPGGARGWYLTNKVPLRDETGDCYGVASLSIDLRSTTDAGAPLEALAAVVDLVAARYAEPLTVADLARAGGMTQLQLERRMRRVLGMSPKQFLLRTRLDEAMMLLATSNMPISDVAARCGYYDQSSLNRHFRRAVGLTPGQYRARVGSG